MEITFNPDDPKERKRIQDNLDFWYGCENNTSQSTLTKNNTNVKKYFCNNPTCKKEIDKSVVAYCLHLDNKDRFKGKVYCRECQEGA